MVGIPQNASSLTRHWDNYSLFLGSDNLPTLPTACPDEPAWQLAANSERNKRNIGERRSLDLNVSRFSIPCTAGIMQGISELPARLGAECARPTGKNPGELVAFSVL